MFWADGGEGGDGGGITWQVTPGLLLAGLIAVAVLLLILLLAGWLAWRAVRKRRLMDRGLLHWRAAALPDGPSRRVALLRLQLQESMTQTRRVMAAMEPAGASGVNPLGELPDLAGRLRQSAGHLDAQLGLLEREPDPDYIESLLPEFDNQVRSVEQAALQLRAGALGTAATTDDLARRQVETDLADELAGLEAGVAYLRGAPRPEI